MPSGLRTDADAWVRDYDEAKQVAQDVLQLVQERNTSHPGGGPEASRMTATARRKLGTLGTSIDRLFQWLDAPEASGIGEQEKYRRRDLLHALKGRREQLLVALKRSQQQAANRDVLMPGGSSGVGQVAAIETAATAALDNRGLVQLQQQVMQQQDQELEHMEKSIHSTKHIALAIGEEVDLHTRLLEELDEEVDVTHTRLRAATKRIKHIMRSSSNCRGGFIIFLLIITLVVVTIIAFKLTKLFRPW